jgi:outer membrane protein assembly factor BamB
MKYVVKLVSLIVIAGLLNACSIFSRNQVEQPAELSRITPEVNLRRVWSVNVGDGQGSHYNRLVPAIDGETIYAASANGNVVAVNKANGAVRWRQRTDAAITGGVGASSGLLLFGTRDARVVALDQSTGQQRWSTRVSSEVLSPPQSDGRIVVAQTIDGRLFALDPATGQQRWVYENTVPALSLRGSSKPLLAGNIVVAGFANGMIAAIDASNGFLLWEERVAIPQGRYDIERIIDVDGDILLSGSTVFVTSYQGNLMGFDLQTGRIVWGLPGSSYHGVALGLGNIYWVDSFSHIFAVQNNTERTVWENDALRLRKATAPTSFNNFIAVGDFEGYLHLLSQIDGRFVGRTRVDRSGIRANILAESGVLYVYGNSGSLVALRLP